MSLLSRSRRVFVALLLLFVVITAAPGTSARVVDPIMEAQTKLLRGEVVVDLQTVGNTRYVLGRVIINQPPDRIWPIMTNPFEYERKICPRMKEVEMVVDTDRVSLMKVKVDCGIFLPELSYIVESKYEPNARIDFKRVGGTIRDFRGYWEMSPTTDPQKTEIKYSLYIDPGFPVPQWVIREGVKVELPRTLLSLRRRIDAVYNENQRPEKRSIVAAAYHHHQAAVPFHSSSFATAGTQN